MRSFIRYTAALLFAAVMLIGGAISCSADTTQSTGWEQVCSLDGIRVDGCGMQWATISWKMPAHKMTNFNIYKNGKGSKLLSADGSKTSITLRELSAGKTYTFGVKGWNKEDKTSTDIAMITFKTASIPWKQACSLTGLRVSKVTENSAALVWDKPKTAMTNFNLYKNGKGSKLASVDGGTYKLTVKGLEKGKKYTYSIKGWNTETYSTTDIASVSFTTVDPNAWKQSCKLKGLRVTECGDSWAVLSWDAPSDKMTCFNLYRSGKGSKVGTVSGGERSIRISGLKAGSYYTYGIKGWNTNTRCTTDIAKLTFRTAKSVSGGSISLALDEYINQRGGAGSSGSINASFGCGGTSLTMLMNSQKNARLNKDDVLRKQYSMGIFNDGNGNRGGVTVGTNFTWGVGGYGTCLTDLVELAKQYGYTAKTQTSLTLSGGSIPEIDEQLRRGHLLVVGLRTSGGAHHFEVICGKSGSTYTVVNPYGAYAGYGWGYSESMSAAYLYNRIYAVNMSGRYTSLVRGILWLE